ncbi:MAG: hypothetical protein IJ124_09630 [Clostridia bacterium]|nr:hypothetical protein [Clostridia bacterium]
MGTKGEMDAGSGYQSKDLSNENNDDNGSKGRGEDLDVTARYVMYDKDGNVTTDESKAVRKVDQSDTKDIQNAKNLNTYTYTGDPEDAVIARITDRTIVSGSYVTVEASSPFPSI